MTRTSRSHPLEIAEIPISGGVIGLTFCPGKKGQSLSGEPWDRDVGADLHSLKAWGASIIVSLMERFEFDMLGYLWKDIFFFGYLYRRLFTLSFKCEMLH